jgi:hypothetical protein
MQVGAFGLNGRQAVHKPALSLDKLEGIGVQSNAAIVRLKFQPHFE